MSPMQIVEVVSTPTVQAAVTTVDTAFIGGFAAKGSTSSVIEITSPAQITTQLGDRDNAVPWLWDALDVFFREGGARAYVGREVGPAPVAASKILMDTAGSPVATLKVSAKTVGTDGNNISVAIDASGGNFTISIYYKDVLKETLGPVADRASAAALVSNYVDIALNGSSTLDPATLAKTALTGGVDDHASVTTTQLSAALALFVKDLGPGQVLFPGVTDSASQALIAAHADEFDRIALLDAPNTATLATIETAAAAIQGSEYARSCAMFAPWLIVPGPLQGQERTVPPSTVAAGLMARSDLAGNPADVPAANTNGDSASATTMAITTWTDDDRNELNDAGVDAFKSRRGTITLWGYRTLQDPDTDTKSVPLGAARMLMQIVAELDAIAETYVLKRMDGKRHLLVDFKTALAQPLEAHIATDSLTFEFDSTGAPIPGTAYQITPAWDPDTREISADVILRLTDMAENVLVRIIRRAQTEAL